MALSLQLGYPAIPKSITNPDVNSRDALDNNGPIPFLTFIKIINVSFEPDSLQNYYNFYIKTWNNLNTKTEVDEQTVIVERYRDFIKDISLNYTTKEEKDFLSKIDFNDPYDLDIAIGFYGKKLKDISRYYNAKRHNIKFNITRNKLRGTNFGTERTISELALSYLRNLDDGKMLYDYDVIKHKLEVEIEELYDTYPSYFNQTPDSSLYDKKDLDYGYNLFLENDLTTTSIYLSGISQELRDLKETDQLFENKRLLTRKYLSTGFYYLSTGNTTSDFLSGKLFDADLASLNFLNREYPTTASTENTDYLLSHREKGFFRPSNTSILLVDGVNLSYSINLSSISPNSLYFFPDPLITGINGSILTFIVDDSYLKKNFSSGNASNQPSTSPHDTKSYGYVSKIEPNSQKYLDSVFDRGFVKDSKRDIYNNLFGLFKDDFRFKKTIQNLEVSTIINMIVNGYQFYDDLYGEGSGFNWSTADDSTYRETIRSGLSTFTGDFTPIDPEIVLYFGQFTPYNELILPTESNLSTTYEIVEGGYISKSDFTLYDDNLSSDLSAFETDSDSYYYTDLIEGGINTLYPTQRALLDPSFPSLTANLLFNTRLSSIDIIDGGRFESPFESLFEFNTNDYYYSDETYNPSKYSLSSVSIDDYPNYDLSGKILVRNSTSREVSTLITSLPYLTSKYNSQIVNEMDSNVVNFEISNDIILVETPSYFTINKLIFNNGEFVDPKSVPVYVTHNINHFNKLSNRYKKNNTIFYSILKTSSDSISSNNFKIYPEIYTFDTLNFKNVKIFPKNQSDITQFFNISGGDVRYVKCDTPIFTHSSRNNTYNISFLVKDQNDLMVLHGYDFIINPDVTFTKHSINKAGISQYSNIFSTNTLSSLHVFLSGSNIITTTSEELVI